MKFVIPKNGFEILDGFENVKKIPFVGYTMAKQKTYIDYCWMVKCSWAKTEKKTHIDDNLNERVEIVENEKYIEPTEKMEKFKNKYFCENGWGGWRLKEHNYGSLEDELSCVFEKHFTKQDLLDYLGIEPFVPSIMLNLSPDWGEFKISKMEKIDFLTEIIEKYFSNCERYSKYSYVIECGHSGENIHAHAVGQINKDLLASVLDGKNSHIRKARFTYYLNKFADNSRVFEGYPEGIKGLIKKQSVQTTICRTEQIVKDKLDYLDERMKPEGHKNKFIIFEKRLISLKHEQIKSGRIDVKIL